MALTAGLFTVLLTISTVYAKDYIVGDSNGWNTGVDYSTWASGKNFAVGDTLLFTYGGLHSVDEVNKGDYDGCTSSNAINSFSDGNTTISLKKTGPHYFLCPNLGHCGQGMKLAVTVSASSSPASGSGSSPTTSDGTTTPSTTTTSTPNTSGAMAGANRMNGVDLAALIVLALLIILVY